MKFLLVIAAFLGLQSAVFAGGSDRFELAEQAHLEKRFKTAIKLWEKEAKEHPNNPSVYFNLGLAYKAEKQYPKAIWAFEKTLKFSPKDAEAIQLIEACYLEMDSNQDWKDETGTFQRALIAMGSDFWSVLAILFSLLAGITIILAKRTKVHTRRKWYIGTTVFSVITLVLCIANASSSFQYEHNNDYAIVMNEVALKDKSLSEKQTASLLPAGTKVKVSEWQKNGSATVLIDGKQIQVLKGLKRI